MYYIVVAVMNTTNKKFGDYCKKVPPVPMPNTAVKLLCAEDSEGFPLVKAGRCRSYYWRISSVGRAPALQAGGHWFEPSILHFEPLAQSVEHLTFNQRVAGSIPAWLIFYFIIKKLLNNNQRMWRNWQTH